MGSVLFFIIQAKLQSVSRNTSIFNLLFKFLFLGYLTLLSFSYSKIVKSGVLNEETSLLRIYFTILCLSLPLIFSLFPFYSDPCRFINNTHPLSVFQKIIAEWVWEIFGFGYLATILMIGSCFFFQIDLELSLINSGFALVCVSLFIMTVKMCTEHAFGIFEKIFLIILSFISLFFMVYFKNSLFVILQIVICILVKKRSEYFLFSDGQIQDLSTYVQMFTMIWKVRKIKAMIIFYFTNKLITAVAFTKWDSLIASELVNPVIWIAGYLMFLPYLTISFLSNAWFYMKDFWSIILLNSERKHIFLFPYTLFISPMLIVDITCSTLWLFFIGYFNLSILFFGLLAYCTLFLGGYFSSILFAYNPDREPIDNKNLIFLFSLLILWFISTFAIFDWRYYGVHGVSLALFVWTYKNHSKWFEYYKYSIFLKFQ
jgi:hypothetical protein